MDSREEQESKVPGSIHVVEVGRLTDSREVQEWKALYPMEVIVSGRLISTRAEHRAKAPYSIDSKEEEGCSITERSEEQE